MSVKSFCKDAAKESAQEAVNLIIVASALAAIAWIAGKMGKKK